MVWTVELEPPAQRQLRKLGHAPAARIAAGLRKIAALPDPRTRGKAMVDEWTGHWRYRFDDLRVIARLEDQRLIIVVVAIGHRRNVYD